MLNGIALVTGVTALGWGFDLLSDGWISQTVSAASKAKPSAQGEGEAADPPATPTKRIKLNYFSASWQRVLQDIAAAGDMEVVADKYPAGRYSRMDRAEHTRPEAMRIVNKELEQHGFRLLEKGQFLILIEIKADRREYPAPILKKAPPKLTDEDETAARPQKFRADSMTNPRVVENAISTEDVSEKSIRYTAKKRRPQGSGLDSDQEEATATRRPSANRTVRQVAHEEPGDETETDAPRRPHLIESPAPEALADVGAPAPSVVYRPRQLRALEISRRFHRAMKSSATLVDAGRNGLPAFSIATPQVKSVDPASPQNGTSRSVEFMISIDDVRNELLIDGRARDTAAAVKLIRAIDRVNDENSETYIRSSTKYACEVAEQLPAEIERIRAARGSDPLARRPVDKKPAWLADQRQRRIPDAMEDEEPARDPLQAESDAEMGDALGNFRGEVNIEVIPDLNAMIVTGNKRDVEQILKVIKQIEQLSEATAPQVHLLHLKNVDSESLAELLSSVFEKLTKFPGRATQPRESVAIIPVTKPNALLIVAPELELQSILDLADELDQPVDPQTEFQVFLLKSAVATEVETIITEFYKERKSLGAKILVIADPRSNALIIRARARDLNEIKSLIHKVDRDEAGPELQVRVFRLKNAVAAELAAVINAAIQSVLSPPSSGGGGGGGGGLLGPTPGLGGGQVDEQFKSVKSTVLQFLTTEKGETRQLQSGILSDIRVTPDSHANSLIVTASEKSMSLIAALVQNLDRPTSTVSEIKVFTLENADAAQMVQQLNALFNNQTQGANQRQQLGIAIANADDASSSLVPLKFSVDARTNSVIAVGSADALRVVEAILLRLDESNLRSRKNVVVRLNNAPATQIATAVTQFFQQQRDLSQSDPNLVSNVEQLEREVIVIPDTVSNNLLVSSTPRYFPDILQMITKLDAIPKQVVIQALIVEVQLNNTDEFGIEMGLQSPVLFDRSLKLQPVVQTITSTPVGQPQVTSQTVLSSEGTPGFNFNNPGVPLGNNVYSTLPGGSGSPSTVGGQSLTNFSLGRVNSQLGYGGLVLSAGSNSVNALLRALASKTKIQILSRPQIRALDSQLAEVFVGQTIPTATSFTTNATTGVISPNLTLRDTGIGMQVTPRINLDGNVVISLYAFRSQLSQQTVNVTTDSRGQPVTQRITDLSNVRSTVLVPSNSTIVIGGMISTRDETTNRKAPFLGDIPVVGQLFRYDSRTTVRSELLIFLTPRIIDGPEEDECLKEIEMGRLNFIESEAEAAHGPLRAIPAPDEVFDEQHTPWIGPGAPNLPAPSLDPGTINYPPSPSLQSMPASPTQIQTPSPTTTPAPGSSTVPPPPPPPLPDPNLTRINALRSMSTDQDDATEGVATAHWTTPAATKRRTALSKKIRENQQPARSTE